MQRLFNFFAISCLWCYHSFKKKNIYIHIYMVWYDWKKRHGYIELRVILVITVWHHTDLFFFLDLIFMFILPLRTSGEVYTLNNWPKMCPFMMLCETVISWNDKSFSHFMKWFHFLASNQYHQEKHTAGYSSIHRGLPMIMKNGNCFQINHKRCHNIKD